MHFAFHLPCFGRPQVSAFTSRRHYLNVVGKLAFLGNDIVSLSGWRQTEEDCCFKRVPPSTATATVTVLKPRQTLFPLPLFVCLQHGCFSEYSEILS